MNELEENTSVEQFLHAQSNIGRRQETLARQEIWCSHWIFTGCVEKLKMPKSIAEKGCNFLIEKSTREDSDQVLPKTGYLWSFFPLVNKIKA